MKRITDDLFITAIDISIAKLIATVKMKYLDYEFEAIYEKNSTGNKSIIMDQEFGDRTHNAITQEVEENEKKILKWVEKQFEKESLPKTIKRFAKTFDIEDVQILVRKAMDEDGTYKMVAESVFETENGRVSPLITFGYETKEERDNEFNSIDDEKVKLIYKAFSQSITQFV